MDEAEKLGYENMYLDSLSTSTKVIGLYRRMGFTDTEQYKPALKSDVFMMKKLR